MKKERLDTTIKSDRWSFLWLAIGAVLMVFMAGNWPLSLAGWLAPLFLIRFMRTQKKLRGFILITIGMVIASMVAYQGNASLPGIPLLFFGAALGIAYGFIFWVDRVLVSRLPTQGPVSFVATLVFPLLVTAQEFLLLNKSMFGSSGSWANTQSSNLVLMQLTSITGLWGLTFIIMWFASTVNWAWERGFSWPEIKNGATIYTGILLLVLAFGDVRLRFAEPQAGTVRVHALTAEGRTFESLSNTVYPLLKTDREAYRRLVSSYYEPTIAAVIREARAGAQIVLLPETAVIGVKDDLEQFLTRLKQVAIEENIYVAFGMWVADTNIQEPRLIIIDPSGKIVLNHLKYAFGMGTPINQVELQTVDTPYGRLSGVLCGDLDNPGVVSQAGRKGVDILLVPATEDPGTGAWHFRLTAFRAVENGFSLVRSTLEGVSLAVDPYGRILASMDYFKANDRVMVAQVPTHRSQTVFAAVGDWFGWLAVAGFVGIAVLAIVGGRKRASASTSV
jgi:apolipoprotein N-acyltransferase